MFKLSANPIQITACTLCVQLLYLIAKITESQEEVDQSKNRTRYFLYYSICLLFRNVYETRFFVLVLNTKINLILKLYCSYSKIRLSRYKSMKLTDWVAKGQLPLAIQNNNE